MGDAFEQHMDWLAKNATRLPKQQPRYKCSACKHRTTRNQAKKNGGFCFACKAPLRGTTQR